MKFDPRRSLSSILKLSVAAALIWWMIGTGRLDLRGAAQLLTGPWLFPSLLLIGLNLFLASERWRLLLPGPRAGRRPLEFFSLSLIGVFFNFAMPGGVGGDVVKAYYFSQKHPEGRAEAITSVLIDRILGLYAMTAMAMAAMLLDAELVMAQPVLRTLLGLISAFWLAFTLGLIAVFSRRLHRLGVIQKGLALLPLNAKLLRFYDVLYGFGGSRSRVLGGIIISFAAQSLAITFLWMAGRVLGYPEVGIGTYFLVAPLGFMATAIPISPAGIGVGQAAFYYLFNLYLGRESSLGPTVITALQAVTVLFGLVGALLYVRRSGRGRPAIPTPTL